MTIEEIIKQIVHERIKKLKVQEILSRQELSGLEWLQEQLDADWEKDRPNLDEWRNKNG